MKKNLVNFILAAMVVAGCLMIESATFLAVCLIVCAGAALALNDVKKAKRYSVTFGTKANISYL